MRIALKAHLHTTLGCWQVGTLLQKYEDEDVPFFWFHSFKEAWVASASLSAAHLVLAFQKDKISFLHACTLRRVQAANRCCSLNPA